MAVVMVLDRVVVAVTGSDITAGKSTSVMWVLNLHKRQQGGVLRQQYDDDSYWCAIRHLVDDMRKYENWKTR